MTINSTNLYFDRKELYKRDAELREALDLMDTINRAVWAWYEGMSDEEYFACEKEADALANGAHEAYRTLEDWLDMVWSSIHLMEELENTLESLENDGVV